LFEKGSEIIEITMSGYERGWYYFSKLQGIIGIMMVAMRRRMVEEIIMRRGEIDGAVSCCHERMSARM